MFYVLFDHFFFIFFFISFMYSVFFKNNFFFYVQSYYFFFSLIFIFYFNSEYLALFFNITTIVFIIFILNLFLPFFDNKKANIKEDFFSFSLDFSSKNILYICLQFSVLHVLNDKHEELIGNNLATFSFLNNLISNPILEVISLSIIASIIFALINEIRIFKNNYLKYQNLSYSLKYIWCHINSIDKSITELTLAEINSTTISPNHFSFSNDLFNSDLEFLLNNRGLFYKPALIDQAQNFYDKIKKYKQSKESNKETINIELSEELKEFLEALQILKKHPFFYILTHL